VAFQAVPDCAKVLVHFASGPLTASIGLWFAQQNFTLEGMQTLRDEIDTAFLVPVVAPLSENVNITGITIYDMRSATGPKLVHVYDPVLSGNEQSTPTSFGNAACISFYGEGRGQANQGRVYVPGIGEAQADQTDIQTATLGFLVDAFEGLRDTPPTGWTWSIVSRVLNGVPRAVGVYTPVLTVTSRNPRWTFQRRRVPRP